MLPDPRTIFLVHSDRIKHLVTRLPPPAVFQICQGSRAVAFEHLRLLFDPKATTITNLFQPTIYINPDLDSMLPHRLPSRPRTVQIPEMLRNLAGSSIVPVKKLVLRTRQTIFTFGMIDEMPRFPNLEVLTLALISKHPGSRAQPDSHFVLAPSTENVPDDNLHYLKFWKEDLKAFCNAHPRWKRPVVEYKILCNIGGGKFKYIDCNLDRSPENLEGRIVVMMYCQSGWVLKIWMSGYLSIFDCVQISLSNSLPPFLPRPLLQTSQSSKQPTTQKTPHYRLTTNYTFNLILQERKPCRVFLSKIQYLYVTMTSDLISTINDCLVVSNFVSESWMIHVNIR